MTDINTLTITARLTRDCELKYTNGGMAIGTFSVAVNRSQKQADGTWQDNASFFDISCFGKTAENLKPYLTKGTKVAICGYLKQDRWQDRETGNNRSKVTICAQDIVLCGSKPDSGSGNGYQQTQAPAQDQSYGYGDETNPF